MNDDSRRINKSINDTINVYSYAASEFIVADCRYIVSGSFIIDSNIIQRRYLPINNFTI